VWPACRGRATQDRGTPRNAMNPQTRHRTSERFPHGLHRSEQRRGTGSSNPPPWPLIMRLNDEQKREVKMLALRDGAGSRSVSILTAGPDGSGSFASARRPSRYVGYAKRNAEHGL